MLPITQQDDQMWVNARSLHQALGVKRDFSNWIKGRLEALDATENEEYAVLDESPDLARALGRPAKRDYLLSLDLGKEVAMLEKNEASKVILGYFIDAEKTVPMNNELALVSPDLLVDSRALAERLDNQHHNVMALINTHAAHFEGLGVLLFQTEVITGRGQPAKYALLNEDQCYFLLSMSRNNETVVPLKAGLVRAFRQAREAATPIQALKNRRKK